MSPILELEFHQFAALQQPNNRDIHNALATCYLKILQESNQELGSKKREIRTSFNQFLISSDFYSKEAVLSLLPDSFYHERAIVLGKLGRHSEALDIYLTDIDDFESALEYCNRFYNSKDDSVNDIYTRLFRLIIKTRDEEDLDLLKFVEVYADKLDYRIVSIFE